jgi:hypothetical protein
MRIAWDVAAVAGRAILARPASRDSFVAFL